MDINYPILIHKFLRENGHNPNPLFSYIPKDKPKNIPFNRVDFLNMAESVVREYKEERKMKND